MELLLLQGIHMLSSELSTWNIKHGEAKIKHEDRILSAVLHIYLFQVQINEFSADQSTKVHPGH